MIHLKLDDDVPKYNDVIWGNRSSKMTWEEVIKFFKKHECEDIPGYKDEQNDKEWNRLLSKVQEKQNDRKQI